MTARRTPDRPERALNILQRRQLAEQERRRVSRFALRVAELSKHCVFVTSGVTGRDRVLYETVRPGTPPRYSWRHRAICTTAKTWAAMRAEAAELEWTIVSVTEADLLNLAAQLRADEEAADAEARGWLW